MACSRVGGGGGGGGFQEKGIALGLGEEHLGQWERDGLLLEHRLDDLHTVLG